MRQAVAASPSAGRQRDDIAETATVQPANETPAGGPRSENSAFMEALADARAFWRPDLTESQINIIERHLKNAGARIAGSLGRHLAALKTILQIEQLLVMQSVNDRLGIRSPFFDNPELMRWGEVAFDELAEAVDQLWLTAGRPPVSRMLGPRQSTGPRASGPHNGARTSSPHAGPRISRPHAGGPEARARKAPISSPVPPPANGSYPSLAASAPQKGESRDIQEMLTTLHGAWRNEYINWVSGGEQGLPPLPHPVLREAIRIWAEESPEAAQEDRLISVLESRHQGGQTQATRV